MAGMIQRALAGGGEALEIAGLKILASELDEKRQVTLQRLHAEAEKERQGALFKHAEHMERDVRQPFQSSERREGQVFTAEQNREGRQHQTNLQSRGFEHAEGMQATALEHAARENAANRRLQAAGQAIQERQVAVLEQGAELDRQVKQIQLNNAKLVEDLRTKYQSETDPAKRAQLSDSISILTGKDNDNFLPVPLKDDMGNVTGYEIFDKKRGVFVDNPRPGSGAGSTGAKWDSGSGKVFVDGKEIGSAKTEQDARALLARHRGQGAAARPQPAAQPRPAAGMIDSQRVGYAEALDQVSPRQRPPQTAQADEDEDDPMRYP